MPNQKSLAPETGTERQTLSVEEAGRILGISRGSAYAYAKDGSLPRIRLGSRLLVPKAALDKMLMTA
jgi:excisionase family DNA binding protein